MLKKYKLNGEIEFRPVYFNSATKTVIRVATCPGIPGNPGKFLDFFLTWKNP